MSQDRLSTKDLVSIYELTTDDVRRIFEVAKDLKEKQQQGIPHRTCEGKVLGMIFQKSSTRTRVSFEAGIFQLGGTGLFLSANDLQIGRGETVADTARVMSRYVDGLMARVYGHEDILALSEHATVPVINGLSDLLHPCQALTDMFTLAEKKGNLDGLKLAYVGDGNNMAHSLLFAGAKTGTHIAVATPEGYEPTPEILTLARKEAESTGAKLTLHRDPAQAVANADAIYTDVWASMGQESEHKKRLKDFRAYQVNEELVAKAKPNAVVLHCLPAHRGEEIAAEVMDGPRSVVFDQAENRLHVQKAVMTLLMGNP